MNNKVIGVISTDWHLKVENINDIMDLVRQQIDLATKHGCRMLICLGDVFDSRISQREEVLNAFTTILDMINESGMYLLCIPGNHDKTDYKGDRSFLTPFAYHPGLRLYEKPTLMYLSQETGLIVPVFCVPFYESSVWIEKVKRHYEKYQGEKPILLSHIAVYGSVNNDGSIVTSPITPAFLKEMFSRVYLGHYHNAQEVSEGVIHLPSIQQNNFGEDTEKGFTLLFEDGDFEFVKAVFKEYISLKVDVDNTSKAELVKFLDLNSGGDKRVKIEAIGSESKLKALNEELFSERGIVLKKRRKDLDTDIRLDEISSEISKASVKELFKNFCQEKGYDYEQGFNFLKNYVE